MNRLPLAALALSALTAAACLAPARAEEAPPPERPAAPAFVLKDLNGTEHKLEALRGKWVVLEWTNLGCPFVQKFYNSGFMQGLQKSWASKGVVWLTLCSSAPGMQGHLTVDDWKKAVAERKIASAAVLPDPDGTVGRLYGAKTTPHMWVIDPEGKVFYTGAIDDAPTTKGDPATARNYVVEALHAGLAGKEPEVRETKPYGCSVKYASN